MTTLMSHKVVRGTCNLYSLVMVYGIVKFSVIYKTPVSLLMNFIKPIKHKLIYNFFLNLLAIIAYKESHFKELIFNKISDPAMMWLFHS